MKATTRWAPAARPSTAGVPSSSSPRLERRAERGGVGAPVVAHRDRVAARARRPGPGSTSTPARPRGRAAGRAGGSSPRCARAVLTALAAGVEPAEAHDRAVRRRRGEVRDGLARRSSGAPPASSVSHVSNPVGGDPAPARASPSSRICSVKRTCIRSLPRTARMRASNVAAALERIERGRAVDDLHGGRVGRRAGTPGATASGMRARRIGAPLTQRGRRELPRGYVTW